MTVNVSLDVKEELELTTYYIPKVQYEEVLNQNRLLEKDNDRIRSERKRAKIKLDEEVDTGKRLRKERDTVKEDNRLLQEELQKICEERDNLREKLDKNEAENKKISSDRDHYKKEYEYYITRYKFYKSETSKVNDEFEQYKIQQEKNYQSLLNSEVSLKIELQKYKTLYEQEQLKSQQYFTQLTEKAKELQETQLKYNSLDSENSELEAQHHEDIAKIHREYKEKIDKIHTESKDLQSKLLNLNLEKQGLHNDLSLLKKKHKDKINLISSEKDELIQQKNDLEIELEKTNQTYTELLAKNTELEINIANLNNEKINLEEKIKQQALENREQKLKYQQVTSSNSYLKNLFIASNSTKKRTNDSGKEEEDNFEQQKDKKKQKTLNESSDKSESEDVNQLTQVDQLNSSDNSSYAGNSAELISPHAFEKTISNKSTIPQLPFEDLSDIEDGELEPIENPKEAAPKKDMSNKKKEEVGLAGEKFIYGDFFRHYTKEYKTYAIETSLGFKISGKCQHGYNKEVEIFWHGKKSSAIKSGETIKIDQKEYIASIEAINTLAPIDMIIKTKRDGEEKKERYAEVKATKEEGKAFAELSRKQLKAMRKYRKRFSIYRVYNALSVGSETFFRYKDPYKEILKEPTPLSNAISSIKVKI